jgi:hypothetical protein
MRHLVTLFRMLDDSRDRPDHIAHGFHIMDTQDRNSLLDRHRNGGGRAEQPFPDRLAEDLADEAFA